MNDKKSTWSILIAKMAIWYLLAKWVGSRIAYLFTPITFFTQFITDTYSVEINKTGRWIKTQLMSIWSFFRRPAYDS